MQRARLRCPYCRREVLQPFTMEDHWYSNRECGEAAKRDHLVPESFIVSRLILV